MFNLQSIFAYLLIFALAFGPMQSIQAQINSDLASKQDMSSMMSNGEMIDCEHCDSDDMFLMNCNPITSSSNYLFKPSAMKAANIQLSSRSSINKSALIIQSFYPNLETKPPRV
ncbi:MAG: hypothetical protein ISR69_11705 [Gammaproteobacteria bacterium]|nr:hypothetical protein [Gammaproteobacteria bacterium]